MRPFNPTDVEYEKIIDLINIVSPENPTSVEATKHRDSVREPQYLYQRRVVEQDDKIVALASYGESAWSHEPGKYFVVTAGIERNPTMPSECGTAFAGVLRSHRRRGIAAALKLRAINRAEELSVTRIKTVNERNNPILKLNQKLGFKPVDASLAFEKRIEDKTE